MTCLSRRAQGRARGVGPVCRIASATRASKCRDARGSTLMPDQLRIDVEAYLRAFLATDDEEFFELATIRVRELLYGPSRMAFDAKLGMSEEELELFVQKMREGGLTDDEAIPHRLEKCGYVPVRNPYDTHDGHWKINGHRQAVYANAILSLRAQIAAAEKLRVGIGGKVGEDTSA